MKRILFLTILLVITIASFSQEQNKKKDIQNGESVATKKIKEEQQRSTFQIDKSKIEKLNSIDSPLTKVNNKHLVKPKVSTRKSIKKSGK